jgi:hypothetical protein
MDRFSVKCQKFSGLGFTEDSIWQKSWLLMLKLKLSPFLQGSERWIVPFSCVDLRVRSSGSIWLIRKVSSGGHKMSFPTIQYHFHMVLMYVRSGIMNPLWKAEIPSNKGSTFNKWIRKQNSIGWHKAHCSLVVSMPLTLVGWQVRILASLWCA